jgi:hypothetical protein
MMRTPERRAPTRPRSMLLCHFVLSSSANRGREQMASVRGKTSVQENNAYRNSLLFHAASLFCRDHSLFCRKKFPVTLDREFDHKLLNFRAERSSKSLK